MSDFLVGGSRGHVPGSRELPCASCGEKVWLAPSGQEILVARPAIVVICASCAVTLRPASDA